MVPAACMLLLALLLGLGPRAAGAQEQTSNPSSTPTGVQRISIRFGGPARSRWSTGITSQNSVSRMKVTVEHDNDALAVADRLAGPAAAELLSTVTGTSRSSMAGHNEYEEDGSLEEGVVIEARKTTPVTLFSTHNTMGSSSPSTTGRVLANSQVREIRMTTDLPPLTSKPTTDLTTMDLTPETNGQQWSTPGSTPSPWPSPSPTAMPSPEDLRVMLLPWGPWHCHCKSGTMSRSRAGKLHGPSGRLRVGALSELRTEHRPCTYQQCPCDKLREECPLDTSLCSDDGCSSHATLSSTTSPQVPVHLRRRPILPLTSPSPSPALAFWKRVKIGLEDIWNSLSSVFTEMQPIERTQR